MTHDHSPLNADRGVSSELDSVARFCGITVEEVERQNEQISLTEIIAWYAGRKVKV